MFIQIFSHRKLQIFVGFLKKKVQNETVMPVFEKEIR